ALRICVPDLDQAPLGRAAQVFPFSFDLASGVQRVINIGDGDAALVLVEVFKDFGAVFPHHDNQGRQDQGFAVNCQVAVHGGFRSTVEQVDLDAAGWTPEGWNSTLIWHDRACVGKLAERLVAFHRAFAYRVDDYGWVGSLEAIDGVTEPAL